MDLDAEQVVRRPDVLSPSVACVPRDSELDLLQEPAIGLNAFTDVWDVVPSRFVCVWMLSIYRYFNVLVAFPRRSWTRVTRGRPWAARRRSPCSRSHR